MNNQQIRPSPHDDQPTRIWSLKGLEGIVFALQYLFVGIFRALPHLFESGSAESLQKQQEAARAAAAQVARTPIAKIEMQLGVDTYQYENHLSGYSNEPRYSRPVSRSQEEDEYLRAEQKIDQRLARRRRASQSQ